MQLKPQDVVVLLKIAAHPEHRFAQAELAQELGMSLSEVNQSLARSTAAKLATKGGRRGWQPIRSALEEFLVHGVRYAFPAALGEIARGIPTAWAAPPLVNEFVSSPDEPPPVWPDPHGTMRGQTVEPLYRSAPKAARHDPVLYELLALVDALRIGRARERQSAVRHLRSRIGHGA